MASPGEHADECCITHYFDATSDIDSEYSYTFATHPWRSCHCGARTWWHVLPLRVADHDGPFRHFFSQVVWDAIDMRFSDLDSQNRSNPLARDYAAKAWIDVRDDWIENGYWLDDWDSVPENMTHLRTFLGRAQKAIDEFFDSETKGEVEDLTEQVMGMKKTKKNEEASLDIAGCHEYPRHADPEPSYPTNRHDGFPKSKLSGHSGLPHQLGQCLW